MLGPNVPFVIVFPCRALSGKLGPASIIRAEQAGSVCAVPFVEMAVQVRLEGKGSAATVFCASVWSSVLLDVFAVIS